MGYDMIEYSKIGWSSVWQGWGRVEIATKQLNFKVVNVHKHYSKNAFSWIIYRLLRYCYFRDNFGDNL